MKGVEVNLPQRGGGNESDRKVGSWSMSRIPEACFGPFPAPLLKIEVIVGFKGRD